MLIDGHRQTALKDLHSHGRGGWLGLNMMLNVVMPTKISFPVVAQAKLWNL